MRNRRKHRPLTPEEAQAAYDTAPAVPLSEERINEIVEYAVSKSPVRRPPMLCLPSDTTVVTLGPDRDGEILALERHAFGPWDDAEIRFRRTVTTFRGAEYRGVLVAYMGLTAHRLRNGGR